MLVSKPKDRVIRDSVHGNISFNQKFIKVIDTPEFQRLRRIKQLSTAYLIFPTAEHTRFTHSIGTYHVMKLIIDHFKNIFDEVNIPMTERSINLALAVALLHDIGHGPFSHAFETALPKTKYKKLHEQWTIDIVTSPESNIYKELVQNFDETFPQEVADLIKKEKNVKRHGLEAEKFEGIDIFFVLSSLISSQLDADRMDYLLRDALFTGVTYGKFDIERLIESLTVTVNKDRYYVCVYEKYLSTIEEYLLARYQMHDSVYFHPFKIQMEKMVKKILQRTYELFSKGKIEIKDLPDALLSIFKGNEITVGQYISLDDSTMTSLFARFKNSEDKLLSSLCSAFLDRNKFRELGILKNSKEDIVEFEKELIVILSKYGYQIDNLDDEYFWITDKPDNPNNVIYKNKKDNIWFLRNDGTLVDLMDVSKIIGEELNQQKNVVFLNVNLLKYNGSITNYAGLVDEIESLIKMYNNRSHIEIEKKYFLSEKGIFDKVILTLQDWGIYEIDSPTKSKLQIDTYYDTAGKLLFKSNATLRLREKAGEYFLTIKKPTKAIGTESLTANDDSQNERFEYEIKVNSANLLDSAEYIRKYIPELGGNLENQLRKTLIITNNRKKGTIKKENILFEMVFDDVTYKNEETGKSTQEFQIEIELMSDFLHRVNLKQVTDYIERHISDLIPTTVSKYKRGLELTE